MALVQWCCGFCGFLFEILLEIVAISPILLVAWQAHIFVSDTSYLFTSLEHYLSAVNGLLFNRL